MPFDVPLTSHARAVDIAARALGRGETPVQVQAYLREVAVGGSDQERADIVREAQRSREIGEALAAGFAGGAEALFQAHLQQALSPEMVVQAIATAQTPAAIEGQPPLTRDIPVRIPVPQGVTLEELMALLRARADVAALSGAGHDSPGGGVVTELRFAGLYEQ